MTTTTAAVQDKVLTFPDGFVWGAATSAYQVEGAVREDGRSASIWDVFSHTPGKVADGDTGDAACDHYHRYADDVRLMAELGLRAYRFSVAWSRIQPDGSGPANAAGLDFYDRLVDTLLGHGIAPYVTLYHWDLPQALEDLGGWTSRETAYRFAEYTRVMHDRLGDRIGTWMTLNEPWVQALLGYGIGIHAPGRTSWRAAFQATHHQLLAHGLGAQVLRAGGAREVALTLNLTPVLLAEQLTDPALVPSGQDADAVRRVDTLLNRQFLDPALRGEYPAGVLDLMERHAGLDHVRPGDLDLINQPLDVLGVNYYSPCVVRAKPGEPANPAYPGSEDIEFSDVPGPTTAMGWSIVPDGLTVLLLRLSRDYPSVSLMVAENGAAFHDAVQGDRVHDTERTAYIDGHVRAIHAAIEAGADLRGYLVWSLLDNFEWAEGYRQRFGIVHVDYDTQRRRLKDSALWYRDVIRRNALLREPTRRPTLEAVAARTGLSRSTVSRVINGQGRFSAQSRDLVMSAVDELGYVPNSAARTLVTRHTDTIALIMPGVGAADAEDPVSATIIRAVAHQLEDAGRQLALMLTSSEAEQGRIRRYLAAGHADGVVLVATRGADPLLRELNRLHMPVVSLGRLAAGSAVPYVDIDNVAGAKMATGHLIDQGRRRITMICGPHGVAAADKVAGYREALHDAGLRPEFEAGAFTRESGVAATRRLLGRAPDVDAVFAANDLTAVGALRALRQAGRRVPDDVAVVGFDDIEAAAYAVPALTTVRVPLVTVAAATVRVLLRRIDGRTATSQVFPVELVVRDSACRT